MNRLMGSVLAAAMAASPALAQAGPEPVGDTLRLPTDTSSASTDPRTAETARFTLQAEALPQATHVPLLTFRAEPALGGPVRPTLGLSLYAHPSLVLHPSGFAEVGLSYTWTVAPGLDLVGRVGPTLLGAVGFDGGGFAAFGAHGGAAAVMGEGNLRFRLEATSRTAFVGNDPGWPLFHSVGVGITWGGR